MGFFKKLGHRPKPMPQPPPEAAPTGPVRLAPLMQIDGESVVVRPTQPPPTSIAAPPPPTTVVAPPPPATTVVQPSVRRESSGVTEATLSADRMFHYGSFAKAQQEYTRLIERNPGVPGLHIKRALAAYRRGDSALAQQDEQALSSAVPMASARLGAWTDLYYDRVSSSSSHHLLDKSLDSLLRSGGAGELLTIERTQFLQREYASSEPLPQRAVLRGTVYDVRAMLEFAQPCWPSLPGKLDALLVLALGSSSRQAAVVEALLRAGASLSDKAAVESVGRLAIEAPDTKLLIYALESGILTPTFVFESREGPFNLMQAAVGTSQARTAKVEALVARDASLVDYPKGSSRPSPWRECVRRGPEAMRHFIAQGFPIDSSDVHTGQTPLMDIVTDNQPACIEPLLRHGSRAAVGWRGGLSAEDLARNLGHAECLRRITKHADVAPWVRQWQSRYSVEDVDALAEALYKRVPRDAIPSVMTFAESVMDTSPFSNRGHEVYWLRSVFNVGDLLAAAGRKSRACLAQFARTSGTLTDAAKVLTDVCEMIPREEWQSFFMCAPWYRPNSAHFNRGVLRGMLRAYEKRRNGAYALFDIASHLPCTSPEDAEKILQLLTIARQHNSDLAWMAAWAQQQQNLGKNFLQTKWAALRAPDLLSRFETLVTNFVTFGTRPEIDMEPQPREYEFDVQPQVTRTTAKVAPPPPPAKLPETLQAAVGEARDCDLSSRELAAISLEEIKVLHDALVDDKVDDVFTEPHVIAAIAQVVAAIIGPQGMSEVFAKPTEPDDRRLRRLFLKWHPDKAAMLGPEAQEVAGSLTALLGQVRNVLVNPQAGPCIGNAYAKSLAKKSGGVL